MAIDILSIKPHKISRDLKGYTILFYGQPKTGKTTTACRFPNSLLLGFEVGYSAIPNIRAVPVSRWSEFKQIIKQLKSDDAHAMYDNIIVDTADIAFDLCEKYVCDANGVSKIAEIPYGGGYTQAKREFDEALRAIPQMGYGLIMISHAQDKTFTDEDGNEYNKIVPTLGNQPRLVVDRMSDIIGYARPVQEEDGTIRTLLFMRGTPRFDAGSRFKYTPDYIEFTYDNLVKAIGDAIDAQEKESGKGSVVETKEEAQTEVEELDFDALLSEFNKMTKAVQQNVSKEDFNKIWGPKIVEITSKYLGKGKKVRDITPEQVEQLALIVDDLRTEIENGI